MGTVLGAVYACYLPGAKTMLHVWFLALFNVRIVCKPYRNRISALFLVLVLVLLREAAFADADDDTDAGEVGACCDDAVDAAGGGGGSCCGLGALWWY